MSTETITVTLPTQRIDGTPLTPDQIASVSIFDSASTTPASPIGQITGPFAGQTTVPYTTPQLAAGAHSFTAEVTDLAGDVSGMSNAVAQTVSAPLAAPNPPSITGTFNQ